MNEDIERLRLELLYFEGRLTRRPSANYAIRNPAGTGLGDILRAASDETLAGVMPLPGCLTLALEELRCRFEKRLFFWFLKFGADRHTAEDLCQELWLQLHRNRLVGYKPEQTFVAFLYVVARNLYLSRISRKRRPELGNGSLDKAGPDLTAEAVAVRELSERIDKVVDQLPEPERSVLRLKINDCSNDEIEAALRMTSAQVYRSLFKARTCVQKQLQLDLAPSRRGRPRKTASARPTPTPETLEG